MKEKNIILKNDKLKQCEIQMNTLFNCNKKKVVIMINKIIIIHHQIFHFMMHDMDVMHHIMINDKQIKLKEKKQKNYVVIMMKVTIYQSVLLIVWLNLNKKRMVIMVVMVLMVNIIIHHQILHCMVHDIDHHIDIMHQIMLIILLFNCNWSIMTTVK